MNNDTAEVKKTAQETQRVTAAIKELEALGHFRVLKELERKTSYGQSDGPLMKGVILDVETTGKKHGKDKIIQLALIPFSYNPQTGQVVEVLTPYVELEDPGVPISEEITNITGITDEDVWGKKIDDAKVNSIMQDANLVIAHNSQFDRPFADERWPIFQKKPWACSQRDIDWLAKGTGGEKLEWLLYTVHRNYYQAHDALADCYAVLHLLAEPMPGAGELPFAELLANARRQEVMVWAYDSPYASKETLKDHDYKWCEESPTTKKCWRKVVADEDAQEEVDWLAEVVYRGVNIDKIKVTEYSRKNAFSERIGAVKPITPRMTPVEARKPAPKAKKEVSKDSKEVGKEQGQLKLK